MLKIRSRLAVATVLFTALVLTADTEEPLLFVFYPARMNAAMLQKKLAAAAPGMQVTVFGRYSDFIGHIATVEPAAILTRPVVLETLERYVPAVRGLCGARAEENMVLLSMVKPVTPDALQGKTVGVVDLLGRKGMTTMINSYFTVPLQIKRVTKTEDLLPLLIFKMAAAVLVPERQVPYIRTLTEQELFVAPVPGAVTGIVALGVREGVRTARYITLLQKLPQDIKEELGVTAWK